MRFQRSISSALAAKHRWPPRPYHAAALSVSRCGAGGTLVASALKISSTPEAAAEEQMAAADLAEQVEAEHVTIEGFRGSEIGDVES